MDLVRRRSSVHGVPLLPRGQKSAPIAQLVISPEPSDPLFKCKGFCLNNVFLIQVYLDVSKCALGGRSSKKWILGSFLCPLSRHPRMRNAMQRVTPAGRRDSCWSWPHLETSCRRQPALRRHRRVGEAGCCQGSELSQ